MPEFPNQPHWFALHTRSNFEKILADELLTKGVESYCPGFESERVQRPIFPGYLFVRTDSSLASRIRVLQSRGAVRLLGAAGHPEPIPDQQIEHLRRMLASDQMFVRYPFLRVGAWVRIWRGALKDVEGRLVRVKNHARLVLSVDLLSQSIATEVDIRDVEVIQPRVRHRVLAAAAR